MKSNRYRMDRAHLHRLCGMLLLVFAPSHSPVLAQWLTESDKLAEVRETTSEVVVYGGTPAGVMAAVAAGRKGCKVVLVEPSYLIGGLMSGGLHKTDIGNRATIGGLSKEYFARVLDYYTQTYGPKSPQVKACDYQQKPDLRSGYYFEPKIALQIFTEMLREAKVAIRTKERLVSASVVDGRITSIVTEHTQTGDRSRYRGSIFIDGSYEGDLMAQAGVMYRVGRESQSEYNEPLAGINQGPAEYIGKGDHRVQSYNIRGTICVDPENRLPIPKPKQYFRDAHYHLVQAVNQHGFKRLDQLYPDRFRWAEINGKMDPNKGDMIGSSIAYSEGDAEQRARILARVQDFWLSHWYLLQNDPDLPEEFKQDARRYGLPKDEYLESQHITPQIYVRVARRMQGRYMLTQHDVRYDRHKSDAICMGSYGTDCHGIQMIHTDEGFIQEGDFNGAADPYEIPYRCITPYAVRNLLVVAAISATHVAYSSVRMEPVFMMLGHAAGEAAHLAHRDQTTVQQVPIAELQERLKAAGMPLTAPYRPMVEIKPVARTPIEVGEMVEFEAIEKEVRRPLQRMVWSIDGSGRVEGEGNRIRYRFEHPGKYQLMLLAWEDEELFAIPATLSVDVGTGTSFNRDVHYLDAQLKGRWARSRGKEIEYRDRVGLVDDGSGDGNSHARFTTQLPRTGRYLIAVAFATAGNRATNTPIEIHHAGGMANLRLNQRTKDSPFAFTPIGEFRFEADKPSNVIFTNKGADGLVQIDTVRWIWQGE